MRYSRPCSRKPSKRQPQNRAALQPARSRRRRHMPAESAFPRAAPSGRSLTPGRTSVASNRSPGAIPPRVDRIVHPDVQRRPAGDHRGCTGRGLRRERRGGLHHRRGGPVGMPEARHRSPGDRRGSSRPAAAGPARFRQCEQLAHELLCLRAPTLQRACHLVSHLPFSAESLQPVQKLHPDAPKTDLQ